MIHLSHLVKLLQHESGVDDPVLLACNFTLCHMEDLHVVVEEEGVMIAEKARLRSQL
jgi:hypothetical protein